MREDLAGATGSLLPVWMRHWRASRQCHPCTGCRGQLAARADETRAGKPPSGTPAPESATACHATWRVGTSMGRRARRCFSGERRVSALAILLATTVVWGCAGPCPGLIPPDSDSSRRRIPGNRIRPRRARRADFLRPRGIAPHPTSHRRPGRKRSRPGGRCAWGGSIPARTSASNGR